VLSLDRAVGDFAQGDVLVEGGKIVAVGRNLQVSGAAVIDARGRIAWRSPQAEAWLRQFFPEHGGTPPASWIESATRAGVSNAAAGATPEFRVERESVALVGRAVGSVGLGEFMLLLELRSCEGLERRASAPLTGREAEVLSWLAKGKTNRDIADILGMSPRTVNKHLEHIFEKLGVETRTAAAALAHQTPPRRSPEPPPASPPP